MNVFGKASLQAVGSAITNTIFASGPWLSPVPTAWMVSSTIIEKLHWPTLIAIVTAATIEVIGISSVDLALLLRGYEGIRRKTIDPSAPVAYAYALVVFYVCVVLILSVTLQLFPSPITLAIVLPFLTVAGLVCMGMRNDHKRRLEMIALGNAERAIERDKKRAEKKLAETEAQPPESAAQLDAQPPAIDPWREKLTKLLPFFDGNRLAIAKLLLDNPEQTNADLGNQVGISRQAAGKHVAAIRSAIDAADNDAEISAA